jgi:hypothetical protein
MPVARNSPVRWCRPITLLFCLLAGCTYYATKPPPGTPPLTCGNGQIDPDHGEVCDGALLGGQTCETVPVPGHVDESFYRGVVSCKSNCLEFDTSNCSGFCGNGIIDADAPNSPEVCDGRNFGGLSCQKILSPAGVPFYSGDLRCASDCRSLDKSGCTGYCGDGQIQAQFNEACDTTNFAGDSCKRRGFYRGDLQCTADCHAVDANCNGRCGDGVLDSDFGEQCDGKTGDTCQAHNFYFGEARCGENCKVDLSQCNGFCGDGMCDDSQGENCRTCPSDCSCGIFGNCDAQGFCECVTPRNTVVECNNGCHGAEDVSVNCQSCGGPGCTTIQAVDDGVTWDAFPNKQPNIFTQCDPNNPSNCNALQGTLFFTDGCEPFFNLYHVDGCGSNLDQCIQLLVNDFQSKGLWPTGRVRFGASAIHTVHLQSLTCQ